MPPGLLLGYIAKQRSYLGGGVDDFHFLTFLDETAFLQGSKNRFKQQVFHNEPKKIAENAKLNTQNGKTKKVFTVCGRSIFLIFQSQN